MKTDKSVTEIIAGALEIFTRGPNGGKLKKARWNNSSLFKNENGTETYCALGALSMSAYGKVAYPEIHDNYREAADLVASCVPERYRLDGDGESIPTWNDNLKRRGFRSVKRAFCKALKQSVKPPRRKRAR